MSSINPDHYQLGNGVQAWDIMLSTFGTQAVKDFDLCNAIKYIARHKEKNGKEDIEKAIRYLQHYLEMYDV